MTENEARKLEIAIGNVIADMPEAHEARLLLSVWRAMARKAADQLDEAIGQGFEVPLTGGGALHISRRRE